MTEFSQNVEIETLENKDMLAGILKYDSMIMSTCPGDLFKRN